MPAKDACCCWDPDPCQYWPHPGSAGLTINGKKRKLELFIEYYTIETPSYGMRSPPVREVPLSQLLWIDRVFTQDMASQNFWTNELFTTNCTSPLFIVQLLLVEN